MFQWEKRNRGFLHEVKPDDETSRVEAFRAGHCLDVFGCVQCNGTGTEVTDHEGVCVVNRQTHRPSSDHFSVPCSDGGSKGSGGGLVESVKPFKSLTQH